MTEDTSTIRALIDEERFEDALRLLKPVLDVAGSVEQFLLGAECYDRLGKRGKKAALLEKGLRRHPQAAGLHAALGGTYVAMRNIGETMRVYSRALAAVPRSERPARTELRLAFARAMWDYGPREEALLQWKAALDENPDCAEARENLAAKGNVYGELPAKSAMFDDLHHFQTIQKNRYLEAKRRDHFITQNEAMSVMQKIHVAWNEEISPLGPALDTWPPEEKDALFHKIHIPFDGTPAPTAAPVSERRDAAPPQSGAAQLPRSRYLRRRGSSKQFKRDVLFEFDDLIREYVDAPKGMGVILYLASRPLIDAVGIMHTRVARFLFSGGRSDTDVEDVFVDGCLAARELFLIHVSASSREAGSHLKQARSLIGAHVQPGSISRVLSAMRRTVAEHWSEMEH